MDAVEEVYKKIEAVPDVECSCCHTPKHPCLFSPSQLERKHPRCRMCCQNPVRGTLMSREQIREAHRRYLIADSYASKDGRR